MDFFILFHLLSSFFFRGIGLLTITTGIVGAFSEKRIKSFFVYSSMGHVGFRLVGLALGTIEGATAAFHYLFVYILTSFVR